MSTALLKDFKKREPLWYGGSGYVCPDCRSYLKCINWEEPTLDRKYSCNDCGETFIHKYVSKSYGRVPEEVTK